MVAKFDKVCYYFFPASIVGIAGVPGFLVSSLIMEIFGRKKAHSMVIIPGLVGWLLIYWASNVSMIMVGRFLGGFSAGATVSLGAIVIGEYSSPTHRGMFLNLKTAAVCLGGMIVHILGNYFTWRTVAMCATFPYVISIFITLTWKESPSWLAGKQEFAKCELAFYWLRGKDENTYIELEALIQAQMDRAKSEPNDPTFTDKIIIFFKKFTQRNFLKPFFIVTLATILLEMCGRHIFPAYALMIIEEITGSKANSFYFTLCIDLIIVLSALFSSVLVRMVKRRTLLFSTGFSAFLVLMTVCAYIFLASRDVIANDTTVPIALFVVYFILANLGCTPIPLALLGELYPLAHRGVGSAVSGTTMSLGVMISLQLTPSLLVSIKVYGTFAVYGSVMGIALLILYFTLPETKDRTLQEIEDYFNYGKFKESVKVDDDAATVKMMT